MKLRTVLISFTSLSIFMTGCSKFDNPFAKEKEPAKEQASTDSHEDNSGEGNGQQDNENSTEDPEKENEETNNEPDLPSPEETVTVTADGKKVITNVMDPLVLVNKDRNLPADFIPEELTIPNVPFPFTEDLPKKQMQKVAAEAIEAMFAQAEKESIPLFAQSGYRSYDRQAAIFASNVQEDGEEEANKYSARPGQSEHQSGLTMDVTSPEVDFHLTEEFGETTAGSWLKEHAHEFGFIIRYPKGKEGVTGYQYEPWHIRYVGKEHAKRIHEQNMTLEEYLGAPVEPVNASE